MSGNHKGYRLCILNIFGYGVHHPRGSNVSNILLSVLYSSKFSVTHKEIFWDEMKTKHSSGIYIYIYIYIYICIYI